MRIHRPAEDALHPALPVTPMLDMAFQLLAFFVMTYHPSDLEGQLDLTLAPAANPHAEVAPTPPRAGDFPGLPSNLTGIVRAGQDGVHDGRILALALRDDAGTQPVEDLASLRACLEKAKNGFPSDDSIQILADGQLKWEAVIQVMDLCRQARFANIRLAAPLDGR